MCPTPSTMGLCTNPAAGSYTSLKRRENKVKRRSRMVLTWFGTSFGALLMVILSTPGIYFSVVMLTRIAGLRSFATMSSFDFAMTVAIGSLIASTAVSSDPPLPQSLVALASLFLLQFLVAVLRRNSRKMQKVVDNEPILLMVGSTMIAENMSKARVTEDDLWAKIREANVIDLAQLRAVVMETTGTISVLYGDPGGPAIDPRILTAVRDSQRLFST